ncbi:MAG: hypothetical protein LJE69_09095 [Thiohalocapsa sp.]|jgi:hypothetical protein|uniref:hypothetical protein n=1 Tax=Thiohalocapsa sp. TaxID=2497641 RepID=UPI0025F2D395|nr:hypothetical protein [Thiohalocapsa sp.]MCG6941394.1 hypothetical protein [Thiohalocapsa sp.]
MPAQDFLAQLATADPAGFWIGVAIAAGVGVWLVRRGLEHFWRLRLIVDTPTARIRSAPQGYVELQGRAAPLRGLLAARLTGTPCVWFRWRIQEYRSSGKSGSWVTIEHGDAERAFLLDDGSGEAEIHPDGAHLHFRARQQWYGPHPGRVATQRNAIGAFFERQRRYRMTEERIAEHESVYVLGHFETPRRGVRERAALTRTLLARWKRDPERMQCFDRDGDGEVSLQEWEHARRKAARLAEQAEAKLGAEAPRPRVLATGDPGQPFVISTEDEPTLLLKLRLSAFGGSLAGALLCAGAAAAVVARITA